ncbi:hypothetical protein CYMTET_12891, partial [Cymbomonas tetramitiformis]
MAQRRNRTDSGPSIFRSSYWFGGVSQRTVEAADAPNNGHRGEFGVTLKYLNAFFEKVKSVHFHGRQDFTTAQVVEQVVLPVTASRRCRYVDLTADVLETVVGAYELSKVEPKVAVSHTWDARFEDVVRDLSQHEDVQENAVAGNLPVWIDMLSLNLHTTSENPAHLKICRLPVDRHILCLDRDATAVKQAWFLSNIEQVSQAGGRVEVLSYTVPWSVLLAAFDEPIGAAAQLIRPLLLESANWKLERHLRNSAQDGVQNPLGNATALSSYACLLCSVSQLEEAMRRVLQAMGYLAQAKLSPPLSLPVHRITPPLSLPVLRITPP